MFVIFIEYVFVFVLMIVLYLYLEFPGLPLSSQLSLFHIEFVIFFPSPALQNAANLCKYILKLSTQSLFNLVALKTYFQTHSLKNFPEICILETKKLSQMRTIWYSNVCVLWKCDILRKSLWNIAVRRELSDCCENFSGIFAYKKQGSLESNEKL